MIEGLAAAVAPILRLYQLGRHWEAEKALEAFIARSVPDATMFLALATELYRSGALQATATVAQRSLQLDPQNPGSHVCLARALRDLGLPSEANIEFERAIALDPANLAIRSSHLFTLAYAHTGTAEEYFDAARDLEFEARKHPTWRTIPKRRIDTARRLRVGIVSAEVGALHAVSFFLEFYLRSFDRSRIELTLYPIARRTAEHRDEIFALAHRVRDLSLLEDADAQAAIEADGIDILLETTAHTGSNRAGLLCRRCAPIQCHYIGFPTSTGLRSVDFFIGDDEVTPPEFERQFSERIYRLPRLWMAYTPQAAPTPEQLSQPDAITLGSFNNLSKVREETLTLWAGAMTSIPSSRLVLKDARANDSATQMRILKVLTENGVTEDRVTFLGPTADWKEHMGSYNLIDIALDTTPMASCTTGFDALYMGTPFVAIRGDWMGGRTSSAMLNALGYPEWVALNSEQFREAVAMLSNREQLKLHKKNLRYQMLASPLCDSASLAAALDDAFFAMAAIHNASLQPA